MKKIYLKFEELVLQLSITAFDCGNWNEDDNQAITYNQTLEAWIEAKSNLLKAIRENQMIDITNLHIHWKDHDGKSNKQSIKPTDATNPLMLKKDVAEFITKIKASIEYYYVVVEIDRGGKPAYRTIIPKTFPKI